ncbi:hypothetical protein [Halobaculum litoreum]|uniref:Uncharacterized protein n=1 Tax=Halobaculum litoreum TaxID=3031998 RepID=A0ABD5XPP0_9EURY|nr:hypothetical protein [Halobaculum sp. DT92]
MVRSSSGDDGRTDAVGPGARQLLAVAVLFAVLGGALVRVATVAAPPAALWTALGVVVVAAAVVLFGADAVRVALDGFGR